MTNTSARRRKVPATLPFGSVSHATMRPEDLIPAFLDASAPGVLRMSKADRATWHTLNAAWARLQAEGAKGKSQDAFCVELGHDTVEHLFDLLGSYCPPYADFGSHPGDGSDYGVWLTEDLDGCFDGLRVDDTADVPAGYTGEVLHTSDHGNPTLYVATRGRLRCIWALV